MPGPSRKARLVQLIYTSGAARPLASGDLQQLADELTEANARAGLTGLLLYQSDSFYGVLEGMERRLHARIESMIVDPRLRAFQVLKEEAIASRRFENWSFGELPPVSETSRPAESFILNLAKRLR